MLILKFHTILFLIFSAYLFNILTTDAQRGMELVMSKPVSGIDYLMADQQGNAYLSRLNGDVLKVNSAGEATLTYSPIKNGKVKQIDVWSSFKIVVFYDSFQEVVVLNRFLSETARYNFESYQVGFVSNIALNFQQNLWVVDESDFTLKLLDLKSDQVLVEQPFFQFLDVDNHAIIFMKEYQGRLYVVDKNYGILIFDNQGNLVEKMEKKGINSLGFQKDKLYCYYENKMIEEELYGLGEFEISLPKEGYENVQKSGDYFFCISDRQLDIYRYLRQ
ncbi:hypothetical protein [Reichenbachiella sp. MALMAid0571]|uniref:hypothetical protein n=1 Tax=Reichenbachiella sp. MALMAid0571 TaxID=3143939 RepID=UPI0032E0538C